MSTNTGFTMPTETVELPSKGLLYPKESPLSSGTVEMKYMTAKEEDILTNIAYIKQNVMFDKLLQSLIVTKINYDDLLVADRDALLVAARILGYGKDYKITFTNPSTSQDEEVVVDLSELGTKNLDETLVAEGKNEFSYTIEESNTKLTFKLLTVKDEKDIDKDLQGYKKVNPSDSPESSTRLKYIIVAVNGDTNKATVRDFVDNHFLARHARAFRRFVKETTPGIELKFNYVSENYTEEGIDLPLDSSFFYPES